MIYWYRNLQLNKYREVEIQTLPSTLYPAKKGDNDGNTNMDQRNPFGKENYATRSEK